MFFPAAKLSEPRLHLFGDRLCETDVGEWALREREREREGEATTTGSVHPIGPRRHPGGAAGRL